MTESTPGRCGYIALAGRPNVGKSTLLNRLLGQKISITARRPQTTRHRILGIKTVPGAQLIFVDTPGLHVGGKGAMSRYLNRTAAAVLQDVDVIVLVVEDMRWTQDDEHVLALVARRTAPVVLAINKVDLLRDKQLLLPYLQEMAARHPFAQLVPLSARHGENVERLERVLIPLLPEGVPYFPEDQVTDRSQRFLAAELVREKLTRHLGQELPYALTCEVEGFVEERAMLRIHIIIWVERPGQKAIVIGRGGEMLKRIGQEAREDMERLLEHKVYLELWVRVREGWSDDERALRSLGYDEA